MNNVMEAVVKFPVINYKALQFASTSLACFCVKYLLMIKWLMISIDEIKGMKEKYEHNFLMKMVQLQLAWGVFLILHYNEKMLLFLLFRNCL